MVGRLDWVGRDWVSFFLLSFFPFSSIVGDYGNICWCGLYNSYYMVRPRCFLYCVMAILYKCAHMYLQYDAVV